MKEISKELQMVYDFCNKRQEAADKNLECVGDNMLLNTQFVAEGTAYWAVKQFIEVNFMEQ